MNRYLILIILFQFTFTSVGAQKVNTEYAWVDTTLANMSVEEKIGQLFMLRAYSNKGKEHINEIESLIKKYKVGGLCFFQGTPQKQAELTQQYQNLSDIPLMIALDAEWGLGMRHKSAAISFPKQLTLGAINDNTLVYDMGRNIAQQLKRIGTHVNFAPVVDVNNNPANPVIHNRSFGEDIYNVSTKSYAYMKGMQDEGIFACAKHFPGHGDTDVDSHYDLPVVFHEKNRIDSIELAPFKVMSQLGVKSMMVAHMSVPALDDRPNRPTSLSRKTITDLLKNKLHFEGLIFTDALDMQGVAKNFAPGEIEFEALKAGNDVLLLPQDLEKAVEYLKAKVNKGALDISVIEQRVKRILKAKYELGLTEKVRIPSISAIGNQMHDKKMIALKSVLFEKAITLVQDDKNQIPIKTINDTKTATVSIGSNSKTELQNRLTDFGINEHLFVEKNFSPDKKKKLVDKLISYDQIIISLHDMSISARKNYGISDQAFDLIFELNSSKDVILVINGSPYALKYFSNVPTILQAYEEDPLMQDAVGQAIVGVNDIQGRLPVSVGDRFPVKTGILKSSLMRLGYALPESVGINSDSLLAIDTIIQEMIEKKAAPGCQILGAKNGKIFFNKTYGYHTYDKKRKVTKDDIYDVASVTKTLATTISLMKLNDEGSINIHKPVKDYIPEIDTTNKANLILEDILAHHSGLPGWIPFYEETMDPESKKAKRLSDYYRAEISDSFSIKVCEDIYLRTDYTDSIYSIIYNCDLRPNKDYRYSDLGYYIFKEIIERSSDSKLDEYVYDTFYKPLGLERTMFNPHQQADLKNIVPTEKDEYFRCRTVHGHVHDMGAAMLGGVCGHAGLFSCSEDLAILMQMLLNGGSYAGERFLRPSTIQKYTRRYYRSTRRGLGFDMKELNEDKTLNMAEEASEMTFGHLGFTGISVFADPKHDLIFIFLSNRTYPTMNNSLFSKNNYRPRVQSVFYNALMN